MNELPAELATKLGKAASVGVITGAGVSAESGIRTYRGKGGLYDDPEEGDQTVDALTGTTLYRDPDRTWRVVAELARQSGEARPNPAHFAIAEIERNVERFVLLTQNVDGLHQLAGSRNVIAIHGNVFATRCMSCDRKDRLDREGLQSLDAAPRCDACGGTMRPDAVLFGEMLPADELMRLRDELIRNVPEVVIIAGTSALFPYIAEPVVVAQRAGRLTIEVNPERTYLSDAVDYFLEGKAGEVMPLIAKATSRG